MDKETLSNYGWIVIAVLVLVVMIALATPFGSFISEAVQSTTKGLFDVNKTALDAAGVPGLTVDDQEFDVPDMNHGADENTNNVVIETVMIDNVAYQFEVGMTWEEWANSKYNTIGEPHFSGAGLSFVGVSGKWGDYVAYNTPFVFRNDNISIEGVTVEENHQIIVGESYYFSDSMPGYGGIDKNDEYYIIDNWEDDILYNTQRQKIDW